MGLKKNIFWVWALRFRTLVVMLMGLERRMSIDPIRPFICPECGGQVNSCIGPGRMHLYYFDEPRFPVPEELDIPQCSVCGEEYPRADLEEALKKAYLELKMKQYSDYHYFTGTKLPEPGTKEEQYFYFTKFWRHQKTSFDGKTFIVYHESMKDYKHCQTCGKIGNSTWDDYAGTIYPVQHKIEK
jgi:hypothetical protein